MIESIDVPYGVVMRCEIGCLDSGRRASAHRNTRFFILAPVWFPDMPYVGSQFAGVSRFTSYDLPDREASRKTWPIVLIRPVPQWESTQGDEGGSLGRRHALVMSTRIGS